MDKYVDNESGILVVNLLRFVNLLKLFNIIQIYIIDYKIINFLNFCT